MTETSGAERNARPKVLVVGPVPPPRGGIASLMLELVDSGLKDHYDFDLFSRQFTFPAWARGPIARNIIRAHKYLRYIIKLLKGDYCLVHVHSPGHRFFQSAVYMLLARLARKKTLLHLHGNEWGPFHENRGRLKRALTVAGLGCASRILVIREQWVEKIRGLGIGAQVSLLPNMIPPIDPPNAGEMEMTRQKLDLDKDDFIIFLAGAGAVGGDKGMLDILEAAPGVVAQLDRARFVIAGGEEMPGQMDHVLRTIKERGLEKWMRILGDIERGEVLRIMSVSSVFLLPSYIEGMPISIMEAFRAGVPVIATPVGAIREMIVHGESGLIIRVGSPRDITESILKTASDETLRKDLIRGGLDVFHRKFDLTRGAEKVRVIYEDMIG